LNYSDFSNEKDRAQNIKRLKSNISLPDPINDKQNLEMLPYCQHPAILKVKPRVGRALLFYNYAPNLMDQEIWHGACPLVSGEKWIAQRWFRLYPLQDAISVWGSPAGVDVYG